VELNDNVLKIFCIVLLKSALMYLIIGWESCPYAKKAMAKLEASGEKFVFLDERQFGAPFLRNNPNWSGSLRKRGDKPTWSSPHIFRLNYVGGSTELEKYISESSKGSKQSTMSNEMLNKLI